MSLSQGAYTMEPSRNLDIVLSLENRGDMRAYTVGPIVFTCTLLGLGNDYDAFETSL